MKIKIINAKLSIAACMPNEIPEKYGPVEECIFFYWPERDWIVFNEGHPDYEFWRDIVCDYLKLDARSRKAVLDHKANKWKELFTVLNRIIRIQRGLYRSFARKLSEA